MKKKTNPAIKKQNSLPALSWQTGDYARQQQFSFTLPWQFLLLSKIAGEDPRHLLIDFMNNLAYDNPVANSRENASSHLLNYFIASGYGRKYYTEEEIRQVFKELEALAILWPEGAKKKLMNRHSKWLSQYHAWWFKKWFGKNNRHLGK